MEDENENDVRELINAGADKVIMAMTVAYENPKMISNAVTQFALNVLLEELIIGYTILKKQFLLIVEKSITQDNPVDYAKNRGSWGW